MPAELHLNPFIRLRLHGCVLKLLALPESAQSLPKDQGDLLASPRTNNNLQTVLDSPCMSAIDLIIQDTEMSGMHSIICV